MGTPSLSIMLIESLKLMHHAKAKDVKSEPQNFLPEN